MSNNYWYAFIVAARTTLFIIVCPLEKLCSLKDFDISV